jgi:predicted thioesterase
MRSTPKVGDTGEIRLVVEAPHTIDFADDQMPAVFSTPQLILHLEHAARKAIASVLESGENSVGIHVDVQHLAPTPMGQEVVCSARIIHVDGATITFQLEAHDEQDMIARGLHKRAVIKVDRFAKRVRKKSQSSS